MDRELFLRTLAWIAAGLPALIVTPPAAGQEVDSIPFISVAPDAEYEQADKALITYLRRKTKLDLFWARADDYHKAIDDVVPREGDLNPAYVGRLTPYPCVAAELLGAKFEILATYSSRATKTKENPKSLTYYSYFVVNADRPGSTFSTNPSLREIDEFIKQRPRTFLYHDKFSTSSYFIPLHYFRKQQIFLIDKKVSPGKLLTPILEKEAEAGQGSSDSVEAVLNGTADLAAVWDGTKNKKKFATNKSLRFIPIEPALPNDLLVVSKALSPEHLNALRQAIQDMPCRNKPGIEFSGEFECWYTFDDAQEAREALADLRRLAVEPPAPVTIRISLANPKAAPEGSEVYLEAARQAVRLAGTEFVLFDPDFHPLGRPDLDWKLEIIHNGALQLTSVVNGFSKKNEIRKQTISISFSDAKEDLTRRIVDVIHTRLNRIRYIWPFDNKVPTVLRDVGFVLQPGSRMRVQKITWINPKKNDFAVGGDFEAVIREADFSKFLLDPGPFPKLPTGQELTVNPMSNSAFRVILERPTTEKFLFRLLTGALVALFALGGIAAVVDFYRARRAPKP
jgi:ABC-type phosphate/phosphonate transport system substrate-binding protein